jgi:hypothetical protein
LHAETDSQFLQLRPTVVSAGNVMVSILHSIQALATALCSRQAAPSLASGPRRLV